VGKEAPRPVFYTRVIGRKTGMLAVPRLGAGQNHAMSHLAAPLQHHLARDIRVELHAIGIAGAECLIGEQFAGRQMFGPTGQGETLAMPLIEVLLVIEQVSAAGAGGNFVIANFVIALGVAMNRTAEITG
jgi:hypothetical protein